MEHLRLAVLLALLSVLGAGAASAQMREAARGAPVIHITSPPADAVYHEERVRLVAAATAVDGVADVT